MYIQVGLIPKVRGVTIKDWHIRTTLTKITPTPIHPQNTPVKREFKYNEVTEQTKKNKYHGFLTFSTSTVSRRDEPKMQNPQIFAYIL